MATSSVQREPAPAPGNPSQTAPKRAKQCALRASTHRSDVPRENARELLRSTLAASSELAREQSQPAPLPLGGGAHG